MRTIEPSASFIVRVAVCGAGLAIDLSVDGRQYVAVTTSNGGSSSRNVPRLVTPEIQTLATGNTLFVFALPVQ